MLIKEQTQISLNPVHLGKTDTSSHATAGSPDEVLNVELFDSLLEARVVTEDWRTVYHTIRPHGSLGGLTPAKFAQTCKDKEKETVVLRIRRLGVRIPSRAPDSQVQNQFYTKSFTLPVEARSLSKG